MKPDRPTRPKPPFQRDGLERLALFYAGRYATTRAKLAAYLRRKLGERGWAGDGAPPVDAIVEHFAELGYVDDAAFARARTTSLQRRGYGERRIRHALTASGIEPEDGAAAWAEAADGSWAAALRFAERKRIGPYAREPLDRPARERAFAAMIRAGHTLTDVRRIVNAPPGEIPIPDNM